MKSIAILFLLFSIFQIVRLSMKFRQGRIATSTFLVWAIIWSGFMIFVICPSLLDWFMRLTMMTQRMNFAFAISIFIILILVNRLFELQKRQNTKLRRLSQEFAVLKYNAQYDINHDNTIPRKEETL